MSRSTRSLINSVSRFLFKYHLTPHSTIGISLAKLLLLISWYLTWQPRSHDKRSKQQTFTIGANVLVLNALTGPEWLLGIVINSRGPVFYTVKLSDGCLIKCHVDHLRKTAVVASDHETFTVVPRENEVFRVLWLRI